MATPRDAPRKRPRYRESDEEVQNALRSALLTYFTLPTKVTYADKMDKSKTRASELVHHAELIRSLHYVQPNLAFVPRAMTSALQWVATQRKEEWRFNTDDIECFATEVSPRIRTMCRHVMRNVRKVKTPQWLLKIFPNPSGPGEIVDVEQEEDLSVDEELDELPDETVLEESFTPAPVKSAASEQSFIPASQPRMEEVDLPFFFGWHSEHKLAWRAPMQETIAITKYVM